MMHALCKHIEIYVLEIHKLDIYPDIYICLYKVYTSLSQEVILYRDTFIEYFKTIDLKMHRLCKHIEMYL